MTSGNWASQLVNKCEAKRRKKWHTADWKLKSEEIKSSWKTVAQTFIQTAKSQFELLKPSTGSYFKLSSRSCVIVDAAISSNIKFLKQIWFLLTRKDNLREGFLAN